MDHSALEDELKKIDFQINITRGLRAAHARYVFLSFPDDVQLRGFLQSTEPHLKPHTHTPAKNGGMLSEVVLNLALTRVGLDRIRPDPALPKTVYRSYERRRDEWLGAEFPDVRRAVIEEADAFARPMRDRLPLLGEDDIDWKWSWDLVDPRFRHPGVAVVNDTPIHVLAWFSGPNPAEMTELEEELVTDPAWRVYELDAQANANDVGHFGFRDGISQPAIAGVHSQTEVEGRGVLERDDAGKEDWRGIRPGEFIVGLEGDVPPPGTEPPDSTGFERDRERSDEGHENRIPEPVDVLRHATYLAFREIEMHVDTFETFLTSNTDPTNNVDKETVAGWMIGRRRNNAPDPDRHLLADTKDQAVVSYAEDPEGEGCPLGAHVRRAHPRDAMGHRGKRTNRHRIIRRGMPYEKSPTEKGLAFISLQARLEDGFEFIQRRWLNDGTTLHLGADPDPIAGNSLSDVANARFVVQGPPTRVLPLDEYSSVRGGEYFVMPTLSGLQHLAALDPTTLPEYPVATDAN